MLQGLAIAGGIGQILGNIFAGGKAKKAGEALGKAVNKAGATKAAGALKGADVAAKGIGKGARAQVKGGKKAIETIKDYGQRQIDAQGQYTDDAINALRDSEKGAIDTLTAGKDESLNYLKPYRDVGTQATYTMADLYGLKTPENPNGGPGMTDEAIAAWERSPDYAWARDQAIKGADRSAAAKGNLFSGGQVRDIEELASGLATRNFQNYISQLNAMSGMGERAANNSANITQGTAGSIATVQGNTGRQVAGIYEGLGDDVSSIYGSVGSGVAAGQAAIGDVKGSARSEIGKVKAAGIVDAANAFADAITGSASAETSGEIAQGNLLSDGVSSAFNNWAYNNALKSGGTVKSGALTV